MCVPSIVGGPIIYLSLVLALSFTAAFGDVSGLLPRFSGTLPIGLSSTTASLLIFLAGGFLSVGCTALGLDSCCGFTVGLLLESLQLALGLFKLCLHLPVI